jgi:hypothetical protein
MQKKRKFQLLHERHTKKKVCEIAFYFFRTTITISVPKIKDISYVHDSGGEKKWLKNQLPDMDGNIYST